MQGRKLLALALIACLAGTAWAKPEGKSSSKGAKSAKAESKKTSSRKTAAVVAAASVATAGGATLVKAAAPATVRTPGTVSDSGPETQLVKIFAEIEANRLNEALQLTEALLRQYPNYRLANLIKGDLLLARTQPIQNFGALNGAPQEKIADLRAEAIARLKGYREKPPKDFVPRYLLQMQPDQRYAVVVDTKRSRLYLYENDTANGGRPRFVADYYVTQGKLGAEKMAEGDKKTPIGVYHVTANLPKQKLADLYGSGAFPLNYPNEWDKRQGRSGSGIWLHGTPSQQYARAPLASDGCVVMANPDLRQLLRKVQIGATPVVTARSLQWISQPQAEKDAQSFTSAINAWKDARTQGNEAQLKKFYLPDFQRQAKKSADGISIVRDEVEYAQGRRIQLKDVSYLHWRDSEDTMVATFGEVFEGERSGRMRRQYWLRQGGEWKLFHEEILG